MVTALMLIDVINDFFDPRGQNYHPSYDRILANIRSLLHVARESGVPVIHCMEGHRPGVDFEQRKLPVHCVLGSHDAAPAPGIEVAAGEVEVRKRRYSAFFGTDLDLVLRERGIRRLVVVGVKSHVCVRATIQDAFAYGYDVALVRECTGSNHPHLHEASLEDIDRYMGTVVGLDDARQMLQAAAR
jgi:maleamate amidohydrolase